MRLLTLDLPLFIVIPRVKVKEKPTWINMNNYHNWHRMTYQELKKLYKEAVASLLKGWGYPDSPVHIDGKVELVYTLYWGSKRLADVNNVLSMIDKFAADALVELNVLDGDDWKHVVKTTFQWGGVDPERPRAQLEIFRHEA